MALLLPPAWQRTRASRSCCSKLARTARTWTICTCLERMCPRSMFQTTQADLVAVIVKLDYPPQRRDRLDIRTPAQPGLSGREVHLPRGKFLGGSSGCNGTICVRGVEQDYDDWGFPQWSGKEMFRAMKKVRQPLSSCFICQSYSASLP